MEHRQPFFQNQLYHVFNRGNGDEPVFRCEQNYEYFMNKYHSYMDPWWETHAWCLMPGQFHFIISVKPNEIGTTELTKMIAKSFADFCNGYVQSYNKHHHRKGSLLRRAFKRCMIYKPDSIRNLTCFIHNQPLVDKLVETPQSWKYSSYHQMSTADPDTYKSDRILQMFGNKREFLRLHKLQLSDGTIEIPYVSAA